VRFEIVPADELASAAAAFIAARAREAVAMRGLFTLAVSGGSSPLAMLDALAAEDVPWRAWHLFQVDERVAPFGHPDRNLTGLIEHLLSRGLIPAGNVHPMGVGMADLDAAAARAARELPESFDLVHLGLGEDGHTASLIPGDPVLEVSDRAVALSRPYQGRVRMTLTFPVLDGAREILWLVSGAAKRGALAGVLARDPKLPASRVRQDAAVVFADPAADPRPGDDGAPRA
jgi:6-phosphogluconolactonase